MKVAIVTDRAWKSLPQRAVSLSKKISALLPQKVEIDVILRPVGRVPVDANGRVTRAFLKKILPVENYDGACLLVDRSQADVALGIKGSHVRDGGYVEFWVCATEKAKGKSYFGNLRFEEAFAHELAHGLYDWVGAKFPTPDETKRFPGYDNTHYWDKKMGRCDEAYREAAALFPKPKPITVTSKSDRLKGVDPKLADLTRRTIRAMAELGKPVFVSEGFRSMERQAELYAQGRTKPGKIVTNAKPGESLHNTGRAVDLVFDAANPWAESHDWKLLGMMFKSFAAAKGVKVSWGGDWAGFKDRPHFELR